MIFDRANNYNTIQRDMLDVLESARISSTLAKKKQRELADDLRQRYYQPA